MPALDMPAYMRKRRARLKAEAAQAVAAGDTRPPDGPEAQRARRQAERARVKGQADYGAPGDRGATAAQVIAAGRTGCSPRAGIKSGVDPRFRGAKFQPPAPPKSMFAVGGVAGRGLIPQGRGMPAPPDIAAVSAYTRAKEFEAQTIAVIAELVARDKDKERRIAALENEAADRRARAAEIALAFVGIFRLAFGGR